MKKNSDLISFITAISASILSVAAVILGTSLVISYYNTHLKEYDQYLLNHGTYSWYDLMPEEIRRVFRYYQIAMLIILIVSAATGMLAFHFNKSSGKKRKTVIICVAAMPAVISVLIPLIMFIVSD